MCDFSHTFSSLLTFITRHIEHTAYESHKLTTYLDQLESLSLEEGSAYNQRLMKIFSGERCADPTHAAESISSDLWTSMRAQDAAKSAVLLPAVQEFMHAQTDPVRLRPMATLHEYFEYREGDVGRALLAALMCFTMDLDIDLKRPSADSRRPLSHEQPSTAIIHHVDHICAKHISIVNDICSWDKELKKSQEGSSCEGSALCNSVEVAMREYGCTDDGEDGGVQEAKQILWGTARDLELEFLGYLDEVQAPEFDECVRAYVRGLGWQMAGNEVWSRTTGRYN